jgi:hypothetical protein
LAKQLRAKSLHESMRESVAIIAAPEPAGQVAWDSLIGTRFPLLCYSYRGDATNQDAIDHEKVHLAEACSMAVPIELVNDLAASLRVAAPVEQGGAGVEMPYVRSLCDMQVVRAGTGVELYNTMIRELRSVGIHDWIIMGLEETSITMLLFALDKGPDNQLAIKLIRNNVAAFPLLFIGIVWCFFHQWNLIIKSMLDLIDGFEWSDGFRFKVSYTAGLGTITNTWRSPGNPLKVYGEACKRFGPEAGRLYAKKVPGRFVKQRWGSADALELRLDQGGHVLSVVFAELFVSNSKRAAKAKAKAARAMSDDPDDQQRELRKAFALTTGELMSSDLYRGVVRISVIAKRALAHFLNWGQKRRGEMNKTRTEACCVLGWRVIAVV